MKHGEWSKIQFIQNFKGSLVCKSFRKYNVIEAWYNEIKKNWVHYTAMGVHFIPDKYVKIYRH